MTSSAEERFSYIEGERLWKDTCFLWGKKDIKYIYDVLYNFYGSVRDGNVENYRYYHSIEHIIYMLNKFHLLQDNFNVVCSEEIELAIWFHDLIQDRGSGTNEKRSAQFAQVICVALDLNDTQIKRIKEMIEFTDHFSDPKTEDESVFLDLDLAILSEDWDSLYLDYLRSIKKEYVPVFYSEEQFLNGRIKFLRKLNNKEWIYNSKWFRQEKEHIARSNVQRELSISKTELNKIKG